MTPDHPGHAPQHPTAGPGHQHARPDAGAAFMVGVAANAAFVVAEVVAGLSAHSLALVTDAGHNAGDVLGLAGAWLAAVLSRRRPNGRQTYGLGRSSILAAVANAVLLLVTVGAIAVEAIRRLGAPGEVHAGTVMLVAALGILVNGGTAVLFARGRERDLNLRAAFQHLAADAVLAAGVVAAGLVMTFTRAYWLDPVVSLVLAVTIVVSTWGLLRDALNLALDAVPEGVDLETVRTFLQAAPGVEGLHDLHVWALSTTATALTAHLVAPGGLPDAELAALTRALHERFGVEHVTLQVEAGDPAFPCRLEPDSVV